MPLELVVNGKVVAQKKILADGTIRKVSFDVPIAESSWVALRILPAAHTQSHIRCGRQEANLCLPRERAMGPGCSSSGVDTEGASHLGEPSKWAARAAYDHAEGVYKQLLTACTQ